jgi:hypothetical protein
MRNQKIMRNAECGMRNQKSMRNAESEINVECGVWNAKFESKSEEISDFGSWISGIEVAGAAAGRGEPGSGVGAG